MDEMDPGQLYDALTTAGSKIERVEKLHLVAAAVGVDANPVAIQYLFGRPSPKVVPVKSVRRGATH